MEGEKFLFVLTTGKISKIYKTAVAFTTYFDDYPKKTLSEILLDNGILKLTTKKMYFS